MPHNNRLSTSGALKMTGIWSDTIGYDPYEAAGERVAKAHADEASAKRRRDVLELARESSTQRDRGANFSQSVFWGLKRKAPAYDLVSEDDAPAYDLPEPPKPKKKRKKKKTRK